MLLTLQIALATMLRKFKFRTVQLSVVVVHFLRDIIEGWPFNKLKDFIRIKMNSKNKNYKTGLIKKSKPKTFDLIGIKIK